MRKALIALLVCTSIFLASCNIQLIDDYLYLKPFHRGDFFIEPDYFIIEDDVCRIRLNGSGFERFLRVGV